MRGRAVLSIVALLGVLAVPARGAQPCANPANCAQVSVGTASGSPGGSVSVPVSFTQGNGIGIGEIAAIAFTLTMPATTVPPLTLADCTPSASDSNLPQAAQPAAALSNFKLVIENAYCSASRTHCLCPGSGSGITPDNFINVVIYGPNPLPTPGPSPVVIPTLPPSGQLFTLALTVGSGVPAGPIPLHVLNQVSDTGTCSNDATKSCSTDAACGTGNTCSAASQPPFTALLSVGDKNAVDQTCGAAIPPCGSPSSVSQVVINDGSVTAGCVGDCNTGGQVTVDEILTMVNIALGNVPVGTCGAGDADGDGQITIDEILAAVNNAVHGCGL